MTGDHDRVKTDIDNGVCDFHGIALFAARGGHRNIVLDMIERGADIPPIVLHALIGGHYTLARELFMFNPLESSMILLIPFLTTIVILRCVLYLV